MPAIPTTGRSLLDEVMSVATRQQATIAAPKRLRRWVAVALAGTLLALTTAAMLGSWRQAQIASAMAADSTRTDKYQQATYLTSIEFGLLQGMLREPTGEERDELAETSEQVIAALTALAAPDGEDGGAIREVLEHRLALQPVIDKYTALLDIGESVDAQHTLEQQIEPQMEEILEPLLEAQEAHVSAYTKDLARAEHDSRMLQLGTILIFVLGMVVLGVLSWSSRSHRRQIEQMAAHDSLTGLRNRAAFQACADAAFAEARSSGRQPTVLVLDLDGFKDVNDSLGHHHGDLLLIEVAQRLHSSIRVNDIVARLGGDEFAVLLSDVADPSIGERAADRIIQAINSPFVVDGVILDIEVSIGIATATPGDDVATVMRHADTAMYAAKEHRLGHARFDPSQANETAARLTLLGDLRRALDSDSELTLHYQPKVAVDTGQLLGAEALARWQHPTRGPISPGEFVPVLESTSLIHRFTAHVLDMALAQTREWLDAGHRVPVAVNVSTRCLLDATFADTVTNALRNANVPGDMLCIEITENTVMADPERAIEVLRQVRLLGVKTAIDDFGTGYSSMAYLKILPVDEIKVDRSFVRDMATDRSNYVLVESAVDLGHNLGLTVVAEGVEDEPVVAALNDVGCDIAQGYHYARPMPPAHFAEFLTRHQPAAESAAR
jgi:diguanylate cyclase (GGDEF)-like protein